MLRARWPVAIVASLLLHLGLLAALAWVAPTSPAPQRIDCRVVTFPTDGFFSLEPVASPRLASGKGTPSEDDFPTDQELTSVTVQSGGPSQASTGAAPVIEGTPHPGNQPGVGHEEGNGGRTGPGSGEGSLLGLPPRVRSVVYLVDRSLSMGLSGSLSQARAELLASLRHLPDEARFQVFLYNGAAEPLCVGADRGLLPATPAILAQVTARIREIQAEGNTNHVQALTRALNLHPEWIFLVTDADDLTPAQVRQITSINRGQTVIHTLDLGRSGEKNELLQQLARDNGGRYRRAGR